MRRRMGIISLVFGLACVAVPGYGIEPKPIIEKFGKGDINWTQGVVKAYGIGKPDENVTASSTEKNERMVKNARENAAKNLIRILKKIRVDSGNDVKNLIDANNMIEIKIREMLGQTQELKKKRKTMANGSLRLFLKIDLHGGFAQLILPESIKHIDSIKHINPVKGMVPPVDAADIPMVHTGLVLDARGISAKPAMAPKIFDENGDEIYGSVYISREFAVQKGVGLYVADEKSARYHARVGINPLYIKALRTQKPGSCDLVISNADANKLHGTSDHLVFLKKCGLIIILD